MDSVRFRGSKQLNESKIRTLDTQAYKLKGNYFESRIPLDEDSVENVPMTIITESNPMYIIKKGPEIITIEDQLENIENIIIVDDENMTVSEKDEEEEDLQNKIFIRKEQTSDSENFEYTESDGVSGSQ